MKNLKLIIILATLFFSFLLKAQDATEIKIPLYKGEVVVLTTSYTIGLSSLATFTVTDEMSEPVTFSFKGMKDVASTLKGKELALAIVQIKKQGYKLITSNSVANVGGGSSMISSTPSSTYIFMKE